MTHDGTPRSGRTASGPDRGVIPRGNLVAEKLLDEAELVASALCNRALQRVSLGRERLVLIGGE